MMRNIYLEGEMGERFGTGFRINAPSIKEVFSCIDANDPSLRSYLIECDNNGIGFTIDVADNTIDYAQELLMPLNEGDITITPVPAGSKAIGKIIKAIIIAYITYQFFFVAGAPTQLLLAGEAVGFAQVMAGFVGLMAMGFAVNLALQGIMELMAPDPATDQDGESSYLFNGSAQNIIEGDPVPVLYGKLRVPGQPVGFEMAGVNMGVNTPYMRGGSSSSPEVTTGSVTTARR